MANTEILLLQPVLGLGAEGDQVKVKSGYARNFLLPRKIALPITQANRKHIEALKRARAERESKELDGAREIAKKIEGVSIVFAVKTGEGGKMFGSITAGDLFDKLVAEGIQFEKRKLHLHAVKELGKHTAHLKLHPDVSVDLSFEVVSENPIVEAAPEPEEAPDEERKSRPRRGKKEKFAD